MYNFKMHLKNIFVCTLNLHVSNDDNFFLKARSENRSGQKMDVENDIFWSDIGSGFDEPGSTPPPRIPRSIPLGFLDACTYHDK